MNNVTWLKGTSEHGNSRGQAEKDIKLSKNKKGFLVAKMQGLYLQSSYEPILEASRIAEKEYHAGYLHILFGLGLGYTAIELAKRLTEDDLLVIIEPSEQLFSLALEHGFIKKLKDEEKIQIFVGDQLDILEDAIARLVSARFYKKVRVIEGINYKNIYPAELKAVYRAVRNAIVSVVINFNTVSLYAKQWQRNLLFNLKESWRALPLARFINKFTCPVIIAASGPSLNKQLSLLKQLKNQVLLLCAGTTVNPLLKAGIKPDIIVTIDGSEVNYRHFSGLDYNDIPLMYSLMVHKDIPAEHDGAKIIFNSSEQDLSTWSDQVYGEKIGYVQSGGSVANFCFDIARQLSSGVICFIGQDLAYTNNFSHTTGNKNCKELSAEEVKTGSKYVYEDGYYGDKVLTDYSFLGMKETFERMIKNLPNEGDKRAVINATEGGVNIKGACNMPFSQFIKEYCIADYSHELTYIRDLDTCDEDRKENICRQMHNQRVKLKKVRSLSKKALSLTENLSKEGSYIELEVIKELEQIDYNLKQLVENDLMYYVMLPTMHDINYFYAERYEESESERTRRIVDKSEVLYKAIHDGAKFTDGILAKLLNDKE